MSATANADYKEAAEALARQHQELRTLIEQKLQEIEDSQKEVFEARMRGSGDDGGVEQSQQRQQSQQGSAWCQCFGERREAGPPVSVEVEKQLGVSFESETDAEPEESGSPPSKQETNELSVQKGMTMQRGKSQSSLKSKNMPDVLHMQNMQDVFHAVKPEKKVKEPPRTGILAKIIDSIAFDAFITVLIFADQVLTFHKANMSMEQRTDFSPQWLQTAEIIIAAVYTAELVTKFIVHRLFLFRGEGVLWNLFDIVVVLYSLMKYMNSFEIPNLSFLRGLRVIKLAKVVRALKLFREFGLVQDLHIMMDSLISCFPKFLWSIVLLSFILYIFAMFIVQEAANYIVDQGDSIAQETLDGLDTFFGTVGTALFSLYKVISFGIAWTALRDAVIPTGLLLQLVLIFFHVFWNIAVANIVTTCFMSRVGKFLQPNPREKLRQALTQTATDAAELKDLFENFESGGGSQLTKDLLMTLAKDSNVHNFFAVRGIEIRDEEGFAALIMDKASEDRGDGKTHVERCAEYCCDLQGQATTLDLHVFMYELTRFHKKREVKIDKIVANVDKLMQYYRL